MDETHAWCCRAALPWGRVCICRSQFALGLVITLCGRRHHSGRRHRHLRQSLRVAHVLLRVREQNAFGRLDAALERRVHDHVPIGPRRLAGK